MKKLIFALSFLFIAVAHGQEARETQAYQAGTWKSAKLQVEINPENKKIVLRFLKENDSTPSAIGITLFDKFGKPTLVELKAIDSKNLSRHYEGNPTQMESFIGFQIKIPLHSSKSAVIDSHQMVKTE